MARQQRRAVLYFGHPGRKNDHKPTDRPGGRGLAQLANFFPVYVRSMMKSRRVVRPVIVDHPQQLLPAAVGAPSCWCYPPAMTPAKKKMGAPVWRTSLVVCEAAHRCS